MRVTLVKVNQLKQAVIGRMHGCDRPGCTVCKSNEQDVDALITAVREDSAGYQRLLKPQGTGPTESSRPKLPVERFLDREAY